MECSRQDLSRDGLLLSSSVKQLSTSLVLSYPSTDSGQSMFRPDWAFQASDYLICCSQAGPNLEAKIINKDVIEFVEDLLGTSYSKNNILSIPKLENEKRDR